MSDNDPKRETATDRKRDSIETTHLRDELAGVDALASLSHSEPARVRVTLDEDVTLDTGERYHHLSIEIGQRGGVSIAASLSVDDADQLRRTLARYVDRAREGQQ
jgi:hypothetical protein